MSHTAAIDLSVVRSALAEFEISPRIEPNENIDRERVFFPDGHRGVLDMKRQLVVGNRGMGKSFWTHALTNPAVRERLAHVYSFPTLASTNVIIGFNGSEKLNSVAPTVDQIRVAHEAGHDPQLIWRAVILRAVLSHRGAVTVPNFTESLHQLKNRPDDYAEQLTMQDDANTRDHRSLMIVFDALDRLAHEWGLIRTLTNGLLVTVLGLQSFRTIRAKVFMRVDQFADKELFRFPDSSKILNDRVDLEWRPLDLYGLLFFELMRDGSARAVLTALAESNDARFALPNEGRLSAVSPAEQGVLVAAIAGDYMGKSRKRGRVYSWVPLHLGDAANNCSPRTFLTAWKTAAQHAPAPLHQVVDHLGLNDGVRKASGVRLTELGEDYPWIGLALEPLRRHFVPIGKTDLFDLWLKANVTKRIGEQGTRDKWIVPTGISVDQSLDALLRAMTSIAVMEERANGKINVPDIFRVEAEILRKGGVAVPRKN